MKTGRGEQCFYREMERKSMNFCNFGIRGLNGLGSRCINTTTKTSAERTRLKRAVLVGGHLARLAIPKDCEPGRERGEDVAALLFFVLVPEIPGSRTRNQPVSNQTSEYK